jgi:hypothetical protein
MTIKELYLDALKNEATALVYCIYYLLMEKKISLYEPIGKLDLKQVDNDKVAKLVEENVLGIEKIGIYSLQMHEDRFVYIFAKSEQEAIAHYIKTYQISPLNCTEHSLDMEMIRGKKVITFRELKKEYDQFPVVVGYYEM